ncbi:hypothetical protein BDW74DRAFT_161983 [Aspergillus multicolor]|uniref:uncharacterized protein n=1 Tax=Aspergillus multicolor TaxID=41759 RepID=UPI003CCC938D
MSDAWISEPTPSPKPSAKGPGRFEQPRHQGSHPSPSEYRDEPEIPQSSRCDRGRASGMVVWAWSGCGGDVLGDSRPSLR